MYFIGKQPDEKWPSKGEISFNNVILAYSKNDPPVLKGVSFTVKPSEKVNIKNLKFNMIRGRIEKFSESPLDVSAS